MAASKSLGIYGVDEESRDRFTAYLLMNFGSVEEQVEAHGYDFQEDIPRVCDELGLPRAFDTKAGRFTIEDTNTPDIAIWVACGAQVDGEESSQALAAMLALDNPNRLQPKEKLIIPVTSMDMLAWVPEYFELILKSFAKLDYGSIPTYILPVDSAQGVNVAKPVDPMYIHWIEKLSPTKYPGNAIVTDKLFFQLLCGPGYYDEKFQQPVKEKKEKKDGGCCVVL